MPIRSEEQYQALLLKSKARHPEEEPLNAVEAIRNFLHQPAGAVQLSPEHEKIYLRWKEIYALKMQNMGPTEIVKIVSRMCDVNENTVRCDLFDFHKVFPPQFNADFEMEVLYTQAQASYNRLSKSTDPRNQAIAQRYLETVQKCIVWFKEKANIPLPQDMKAPVYILTMNPRDIGIDEDIPDAEILLRKYRTRKNITHNAIDTEFEDVG
jgi:hypothetical protein